MGSATSSSFRSILLVAITMLFVPGTRPAEAQTGLELDGANDYVTFGTASDLGVSTFTAEAWIFRNGPGTTASTGTGKK